VEELNCVGCKENLYINKDVSISALFFI